MYYMYHKDWVPELVALRHKHPAVYGDFRLFVSGIERETGIAPTNVIDVASLGFNHPYEAGVVGITGAELVAMFEAIAAPSYVRTGAEGQILESQGKYIREMLFPPTLEDI
jgi:hypothetical protein